MGCSDCYDAFDENLIPLIKRIHGSNNHTGKVPKRKGGDLRIIRKIEDLREEMQRVVEEENFERAAEIRDEINELEKNWGRIKVELNLSQWVTKKGPQSDIVISSRIRLARNIVGYSYPHFANDEDLAKIIKLVCEAAKNYIEEKINYINIGELPDIEKELLVEKNLVSPELIKAGKEKGILLNDDENICIMINEEDHLRIQVLLAGLQLDDVWQIAGKIDDTLEEEINFAFSKKWGYLSACPTNLGTGLRASVMVHLPALNFTDNISKMLRAVSKLGLVVRGIYGEGSESIGNMYQISNQITLGRTEEDIIDNLKSVTSQIIQQERQARKNLLYGNEVVLRDQIMRSYGTLKYAYKISSNEAMKLLSYVKLGADMGIIGDVDPGQPAELMVLIRPAHLQKYVGKELGPEERSIKRAELIQEKLKIKEE